MKTRIRRSVEVILLLAAGGLVIFGLWSFRSPETPENGKTAAAVDSAARVSKAKMTPAPLRSLGEERSVSEALGDASLAAEVKLALAEDARLERFRFAPEARDGRVTLQGNVQTRAQRRRAAEVAAGVEGVHSVTNEITVQGQPVTVATHEQESSSDEQESSSDEQESSSDAPGAAYHLVEPGETLWVIAHTYDTSVEQLKRLNNLRSNSLHPGDRLRVR